MSFPDMCINDLVYLSQTRRYGLINLRFKIRRERSYLEERYPDVEIGNLLTKTEK